MQWRAMALAFPLPLPLALLAGWLAAGSPVPVRLAGSSDPAQGRLEVLRQGVWAAVGDEVTFNQATMAEVVCRQLGYARGLLTLGLLFFPKPSTAPVWQRGPSCTGNESSVVDCAWSNLLAQGGTWARDVASVACTNSIGGVAVVANCLPACLAACPPVCLLACLPVCLLAYLPVWLPACLPACLPTCLSGCLTVCPFITPLPLPPSLHSWSRAARI